MAICQKCGAEVADGYRFCMHCGAPMQQQEQQCVITPPSDPFAASSFISEGCSAEETASLAAEAEAEAAPTASAEAAPVSSEPTSAQAAAPSQASAAAAQPADTAYQPPAAPHGAAQVPPPHHPADADIPSAFALFGVLFAFMIPVVGQILAIVWAVGRDSNPFLRNLSRGYLLLVAVLIVFAGFTALSGFLTYLIFLH